MHNLLTARLFACLILLAASVFAIAQDEERERIARAEADISQELLQIDGDILRDRERLRSAESALTNSITPSILEDARLDLASLRSRESGLKTRLKARRNKLSQLDADIADIESSGSRATRATA